MLEKSSNNIISEALSVRIIYSLMLSWDCTVIGPAELSFADRFRAPAVKCHSIILKLFWHRNSPRCMNIYEPHLKTSAKVSLVSDQISIFIPFFGGNQGNRKTVYRFRQAIYNNFSPIQAHTQTNNLLTFKPNLQLLSS